MDTIFEIFRNAIYRIPDYQRGYSWEESHLLDFWHDIENIRTDKYHFFGTLTLEKVTKPQYEKWRSDKWIIEGVNFTPYYIVDGQQRITTIIILIASIIETLDSDEQLLYQDKAKLTDTYLFQQDSKKIEKSYMFGYEIDNPSDEFFKTKILNQISNESYTQPETLYTNNLRKAKDFFVKKIKKYTLQGKDTLLKKVTQQLKFDVKVIEDELDTFLVFETMNNRGKSLSNLEKLKNRLIYLSTLMSLSPTQKEKLRGDINQAWKIIYENLGKNKERSLSDDEFLRAHWIVYSKYDKGEANVIEKSIFGELFSQKNKDLTYSTLLKYINSISLSAVEWYKIFNPEEVSNKEVLFWLEKLNRLRFGQFQPLILATFIDSNCDDDSKVRLLKVIEKYIVLVFNISGKKSDTGSYSVLRKANDLFENRTSIHSIINEIDSLIFGEKGYYNLGNFEISIKELFKKEEGFFTWTAIRYVLDEYEDNLRIRNNSDVKVNPKSASIEHILPQESISKDYWNIAFKDVTLEQRKVLTNNLGNLLLVSRKKNSELSNRSFSDKKQYTNPKGDLKGYFNGSYSEIEVNLSDEWTPVEILKRGLNILAFMEERWGIEFGGKQKKINLLQLDFLNTLYI